MWGSMVELLFTLLPLPSPAPNNQGRDCQGAAGHKNWQFLCYYQQGLERWALENSCSAVLSVEVIILEADEWEVSMALLTQGCSHGWDAHTLEW